MSKNGRTSWVQVRLKTVNINVLFSNFLTEQKKPDRRNFKAGLIDGIF
jgi:hypothetical protein